MVGGHWWAAVLVEGFGIVLPAVLGQVSARRRAGWGWALVGGAAGTWAYHKGGNARPCPRLKPGISDGRAES